MNLYLAGMTTTDIPVIARIVQDYQIPFHFLISYQKNLDLDMVSRYFSFTSPLDLFLDSGAFSVFTRGISLDIKEYCTYIKRYQGMITIYANLDVIGDAKASWENQQYMEDQGLTPLPVFHLGEPWEYLERYIERYPYIALGIPLARYRVHRKLMPWLLTCFKLAKGRSVYHGFGCTSWSLLTELPWYSVDSTAWLAGRKFHHVSLFHRSLGKYREFFFGNYHSCYQMAPTLREMGFDPTMFLHHETIDKTTDLALGMVSSLQATRWLTERHGNIHIPERKVEYCV